MADADGQEPTEPASDRSQAANRDSPKRTSELHNSATGPDINQPGGRFHPSTHPNIAGRERELRSLADSVRRLIVAANDNSASPEETAQFAAELDAIADRLEATVKPDFNRHALLPSAPRASGQTPDDPRDLFNYDYVLGPYNPLALPIRSEWHPPKAVCYAQFTHPYEGPPGCVHGAVLAAAFDQVFNVANMMSGVPGPTARLSLNYHKPTPLEKPIVFEAEVVERAGKKITTKGIARCGDAVTVRAEGLFIMLSSSRIGTLREEAAKKWPELSEEHGGKAGAKL